MTPFAGPVLPEVKKIIAASPGAGEGSEEAGRGPSISCSNDRPAPVPIPKLIVPNGSTELRLWDTLTMVTDPRAESALAHLTGQPARKRAS